MSQFTVRDGFIYRTQVEVGDNMIDRTYYPGDTVELTLPKGVDAPHQLEEIKASSSKSA